VSAVLAWGATPLEPPAAQAPFLRHGAWAVLAQVSGLRSPGLLSLRVAGGVSGTLCRVQSLPLSLLP